MGSKVRAKKKALAWKIGKVVVKEVAVEPVPVEELVVTQELEVQVVPLDVLTQLLELLALESAR